MNAQEEIQNIAAQHGVAVVYDQNAVNKMRRVEKRDVWDVVNIWGNGEKSDVQGGAYARSFHPGRDIQWDRSRVGPQAKYLDEAGIITLDSMFEGGGYNPSGLFEGAQGVQDFANLIDACNGKHAKQVFDIAPDLFFAQELIRQTGEIETEDFVELTARQHLTFVNRNTWLHKYIFNRLDQRGHGYSLPIDIQSHAGIPTPTHARQRTQVFRNLYHHFSGAVWNILALEQLAETRANGAPDFNVIAEDTAEAQMEIRRTENAFAYFGHPDLDIEGLLNNSEITSTAAPQQLGANTDPEEDRALFVDVVCAVITESVNTERVDKILVGTGVWCYLNTTIFKTVATDSTRTLMSVIMEAIGPLGVKSIEWAPEMDFRAAQAARLQNEHGFSAALAQRWAGGVGGTNAIMFMSSSRAKGSVSMGKALGARPQERFRDDVEIRYVASSGGFDVRKPAAFRELTDVGPA